MPPCSHCPSAGSGPGWNLRCRRPSPVPSIFFQLHRKEEAEEDDAPVHEEAARDSDADEGEDAATEDADEDAAADHDPGTDDCFRGD